MARNLGQWKDWDDLQARSWGSNEDRPYKRYVYRHPFWITHEEIRESKSWVFMDKWGRELDPPRKWLNARERAAEIEAAEEEARKLDELEGD